VTDLEIAEAGKGVHILSSEFLAAGATDKNKNKEETNSDVFKDPVADNRYRFMVLT